jgi:hypothetical protein
MGAFRDFVAGLLEIEGAAVEPVEPDGLEVLAPASLSEIMGWPEQTRLGFAAEVPAGAIPVSLESDWLDQFGGLLGERGRWAERQMVLPGSLSTPSDPERLFDRALDLPNAVARLDGVEPAWARCLLLAFRYAAVSDDKREGLVWLGFNQSTGAVLDNVLSRLQPLIAQDTDWLVPEPGARRVAGPAWEPAALDARVRPLLLERVRRELDPFLRAMRRRFDRDHARVHEYHDELRRASHCKLATLACAVGDKSEADRKRETLRVAAIEREYAAKLEDLRHNYALSVTIEWVQALELFVPVQRFSALVRRRKGERLVRLDWHPVARLMEPPLCDWGAGIERTRLVCDEKLHLTEPAGQAPCPACGKAWCRACSPAACPRCGQPIERPTYVGALA